MPACLLPQLSLTFALIAAPAVPGAEAHVASGSALLPQLTTLAPDAPPTVELMPGVPRQQTVSFKTTKHDIVVEGSRYTDADLRLKLRSLRVTVHDFEETGQRIGFVIFDVGTGASLSYNPDEAFYPASSIKGPYVVSLFDRLLGEGGRTSSEMLGLVEPTIVESDNRCYATLRRRYGGEVFADWCVECGIVERGSERYDELSARNYPQLSTAELAQLWKGAFGYLNGGGDEAQTLAEIFARREESPLRDAVGEGALTIAKAGWYPDDGYHIPATVDAGIVVDDGHCFVIAVMTDAPGDLDLLGELAAGLYASRGAIL